MSITTIDLSKIEGIKLDAGAHDDPEDGLCVMEAVSYVTGEAFSDHPKCVSPVIGAYARRLNDGLPDDERQKLLPFIPAIVGTAGDGLDDQRSYLLADWSIRVGTPRLLDVAGFTVEASRLRALKPVTDDATLSAARDAAWSVREATYDARNQALREKIAAELAKQKKPAAAAAAVADAAAAAEPWSWSGTYGKVYAAVKPIFVERYRTAGTPLADAIRQNQAEGIELLGRLAKAE